MLPRSKSSAAVSIPHAAQYRSLPEKQVIQNQQSKGRDATSAKVRRNRISHPALPKLKKNPMAVKETVTPLKKATGKINQRQEIKTAKAEIRKGKPVTHSRRTIDTVPNRLLRIKAETESPENA